MNEILKVLSVGLTCIIGCFIVFYYINWIYNLGCKDERRLKNESV